MRTFALLALVGLSACFNKTPPEDAVSGTTGSAGGTTTDSTGATTGSATGTGAVGDVATPAVLTEEQKAIARRQKATEATALLTTGKFEDSRRALSLLKELEADLPDSPTVAYNMGLAQEQLGNRAMAEQAYRRATQLDPELAEAWLRLGGLAEAGGDINYASQVYGQGMRAAPENMDLHVAAIGVLVRQGRLDEAEAEAKKALGINANAQAIYANLALIYIEQGRLELGKFIINRAFNFVDGAKDNAHLHAYLGRIFYLEDHPFAARDSYEKALELDPELLDAMLFLSEVHLDNRAYNALVPMLESAVKVAPDDPAIHMNLGIGYRGLQRFEEAEKEYRKVMELAPGRPEPLLNLAMLYGDHQKKYDEAMAILDQYKGMVGADVELADTWVQQYEEEKERAARAEARRKRAEERRKKREEEQRFLEEFERKKQEEEEAARRAAEEAARAAEAGGGAGTPEATPGTDVAPEATPGTDSAPEATPGTEAAPTGAATPEPAVTPEATPEAAPTPEATPEAAPTPEVTPEAAPTPEATPTPEAAPTGAATDTPAPEAAQPEASAPASAPGSWIDAVHDAADDGTAPAEPVSEPADSTPEPAAPSEPAAEDAAGQSGESAEPAPEESPPAENPWG